MEIEDYHEDVVIRIAVRKVSLTSQVTFQKFIMKVSNYVKAFFRIVRFAIRNLQNKAIYKITFQKFLKVSNINRLLDKTSLQLDISKKFISAKYHSHEPHM